MPRDYDFPSACAALNGSPNDDFAADADVNTLAHETEETTTDEDLTNGSTANMNLGGKDYLIQRNWVNVGNGGCLVQYP